MARDDLHFRLRIPEDLKNRVENAAKENHRSMTAEIVARLKASFAEEVESIDQDGISISIPTGRSPEERESMLNVANAVVKFTQFLTKAGNEDSELAELFRVIANDELSPPSNATTPSDAPESK